MNIKEKLQLFITLIIVILYSYLVVVGKAQVEGFVVLAMYVIKKFLDIVEINNGGVTK